MAYTTINRPAQARVRIGRGYGLSQANSLIQSKDGLVALVWTGAYYLPDTPDLIRYIYSEKGGTSKPNYDSYNGTVNVYPGYTQQNQQGVVWLGNFIADVSGTWTFASKTDDGSRMDIAANSNAYLQNPTGIASLTQDTIYDSNYNTVYIGRPYAIFSNNWQGGQGEFYDSGTIDLTAGQQYTIRAYGNNCGGSDWAYRFYYRRPGEQQDNFLTDNNPPWIINGPRYRPAQTNAKIKAFGVPQFSSATTQVGSFKFAQAQMFYKYCIRPAQAQAKVQPFVYGQALALCQGQDGVIAVLWSVNSGNDSSTISTGRGNYFWNENKPGPDYGTYRVPNNSGSYDYYTSNQLPLDNYPGYPNGRMGVVWQGSFTADVGGNWIFATNVQNGAKIEITALNGSRYISSTSANTTVLNGTATALINWGLQNYMSEYPAYDYTTIALTSGQQYSFKLWASTDQYGASWRFSFYYRRPADTRDWLITENAPPWMKMGFRQKWSQANAKMKAFGQTVNGQSLTLIGHIQTANAAAWAKKVGRRYYGSAQAQMRFAMRFNSGQTQAWIETATFQVAQATFAITGPFKIVQFASATTQLKFTLRTGQAGGIIIQKNSLLVAYIFNTDTKDFTIPNANGFFSETRPDQINYDPSQPYPYYDSNNPYNQGIIFIGTFICDTSGSWMFKSSTDDGSFIQIISVNAGQISSPTDNFTLNGNIATMNNNWGGGQAETPRSGTISLVAGQPYRIIGYAVNGYDRWAFRFYYRRPTDATDYFLTNNNPPWFISKKYIRPAQAQTKIKAIAVLGNGQAISQVGGFKYSQAVAYIRLQQRGFAQAFAHWKFWFKLAQAQALILVKDGYYNTVINSLPNGYWRLNETTIVSRNIVRFPINGTAVYSSNAGSWNAPDYAADGNYGTSWSTPIIAGNFWRVDWSVPQTIDKIVLWDRFDGGGGWGGDWWGSTTSPSFTIDFSDGSQVTVPGISNGRTPTMVKFNSKTVTWFRVNAPSGQTIGNPGFEEIEAFFSEAGQIINYGTDKYNGYAPSANSLPLPVGGLTSLNQNSALYFDGNSYIIIPSAAQNTPPPYSYTTGTIEAIFKFDTYPTANVGNIIVKRGQWGIVIGDGERLYYSWGDSNYIPTGIFVRDGQYHHVVLTFDAGLGLANIYLDGKFVLTNGYGTTSTDSDGLVIGSNFVGTIDEVAVYNYVLDSGTIQNHYNNAKLYRAWIGQASSWIEWTPRQTSYANAYIVNTRNNLAQAKTWISLRNIYQGIATTQIGSFKYAQTQAYMRAFNVPNVAQALGYIFVDITTPRRIPSSDYQSYTVRFNGYKLPGYVQNESITTTNYNLNISYPTYMDGSLIQNLGEKDWQISLTMKVWEPTYQGAKDRLHEASTILRSSKNDFKPLFIGYKNKYYLAIPTKLSYRKEANIGERSGIITYMIDFIVKPYTTST